MGELVVSGGDAAPLFELGEEAFDAPALLIGNAIIAVLVTPVLARRDHGFAALFEDQVMKVVGVVGAVGEDLLGGKPADQIAGRRHVVLLSGSQREAHRQAQRIYDGVDFGPEPASGATESLGLSAPLFVRAPAA